MTDEIHLQMVKLLSTAQEPLTLKQLTDSKSPYALPSPARSMPLAELEALAEAAVAQGQLFRYPRFGSAKGDRYWGHNPEHYTRKLLEERLASGPMTWSEVFKGYLKSRLKGHSEDKLKLVLNAMAKDGALRIYPPLPGARTSYYATPSDSADRAYFRLLLDHILKKPAAKMPHLDSSRVLALAYEVILEKANEAGLVRPAGEAYPGGEPVGAVDLEDGESDGQVETTGESAGDPIPTGEALDALILQAMHDVAAESIIGDFVLIPDLRERLAGRLSKPEFDRAVLDLARRRVINIHWHDSPGHLSSEEREALLKDDRGNYYNGASIRSN